VGEVGEVPNLGTGHFSFAGDGVKRVVTENVPLGTGCQPIEPERASTGHTRVWGAPRQCEKLLPLLRSARATTRHFAFQDSIAGNAISHVSPSAHQSKRISPFNWRIIPSITRVPKPRRVGGSTGEPLISTQRSTSPSEARDHST
jgi:hypothetical protein